MADRKKRHWLSLGALGARRAVSIGYGLMPSSLVAAILLVAAASSAPGAPRATARMTVTWAAERGDYVYRLRGRYSIRGVSDDYATSIANDTSFGAATSDVYVPSGSYRVTLEAGYTLERSPAPSVAAVAVAPSDASVEVVPASLLSGNPLVVFVETGRVARLGLSLVDMPGTAAEPEPTCLNGS